MTESRLVQITERNEWLEADGLGGFASGTVTGVRIRRYHGLLLTAMTPPTGRVMLINGFEAWIDDDSERFALSSQRYSPDVIHPNGASHITAFSADPWPSWTYQFANGLTIEHQLFVPRHTPMVVSTWRRASGPTTGVLHVRPLASGRDIHALHHENANFRFDAGVEHERITWQPYDGLPSIIALSNGTYAHDPLWYRNFLYREERDRGLDFNEDLASFGTFTWSVDRDEAILVLAAQSSNEDDVMPREQASVVLRRLRDKERRRRGRFETRLHRAADAYIVRRGNGQTIVAGYPWFTDWGRDTFISLRGLCLAGGRLDEARDILMRWAGEVSEGMLPNRFVESGDAPEFNSVDAALWYVVAVYDFQRAMKAAHRRLSAHERTTLNSAVEAILDGYAAGTRHGIRMDADGLLQAGEPGVQLTWMDAKVGDWVVTPRIGKPVELQALWLNALEIGHELTGQWLNQYETGRAAFHDRFWNEAGGFLYDVVDVNHQPGTADASFRPNQILAVGGLPMMVCAEDRARQVVDQVEPRLWTPIGLRTLEPAAPDYKPRYEGGVLERDGAYHQGTAWPWLLGPFVEAWVRVRGADGPAREAARNRFVAPLLDHLDQAGIGHISEIADAEAPHAPRGCPFQAWSVGEALRVLVEVLGERPVESVSAERSRGASESRVTAVR